MSCIEGKGGLKDIHCNAQKFLVHKNEIGGLDKNLISYIKLEILSSVNKIKWVLMIEIYLNFVLFECFNRLG